MAFVVEIIPDSAFSGALERFKHCRLPSSKWVVDHERNIYMALINKVGGPYDGTQETHDYVIFWQNIEISIVAEPLKETYSSQGTELNWRIREVNIPDGFELQGDDLVQIIFDALAAKGRWFDGGHYCRVNIECSSPVEFNRPRPLTEDEIVARAEFVRLQDELKVELKTLEGIMNRRRAWESKPWWRKLLGW